MDMLKVCFKHFIYDLCIDIIFNRIKANFNTATINRVPVKGEYLSKISHKYDDEHYYNCVVKNVEERINNVGKEYHVIDVTYELCDGRVFDDMEWLENQMNDQMDSILTEEDYAEYIDEKEEFDGYFDEVEKDYGKLLDDNDTDAIERRDVLSLKYELYYFFR